MRRIFLLFALLLAAQTPRAQTTVPFVGCPSEGMSGHVKAPIGRALNLQAAPHDAARLAYYSSSGASALAPRGWHCLNINGSNGAFLVVSPSPLNVKNVYAALQKSGFTGPIVFYGFVNGFTSGRDEVAPVILRVFPAHKRFADDVATSFDQPRPKFLGPYQTDQLRYLSDEAVEFTTPAGMQGIGTLQPNFVPDENPISGVHILVHDGKDCCHLVSVLVRLPPTDAHLARVITSKVEREVLPTLKRRPPMR